MPRRPSVRSPRLGRVHWAEVVADLSRSGQPLARYADERGLSARTLMWWRWKLKAGPHADKNSARRPPSQAQRASSSRPMSFLPVYVLAGSALAPTDGALCVVLPGGRRIEIRAGFDGATLEHLIRTLEAISC